MKKIDFKSFIIGILSLSIFLLMMGQRGSNGTFDQIECNSITMTGGEDGDIYISDGMIMINDDKTNTASVIASYGFGVFDSDFETANVFIGATELEGGWSGTLELYFKDDIMHNMSVSEYGNGLYNVYDKYGNVGYQLNGNGNSYNK